MKTQLVYNENYGDLPKTLLSLFRRSNVSPTDWDMMLSRWGFSWGDKDLPWEAIANHVTVHLVNGTYRYPMYG